MSGQLYFSCLASCCYCIKFEERKSVYVCGKCFSLSCIDMFGHTHFCVGVMKCVSDSCVLCLSFYYLHFVTCIGTLQRILMEVGCSGVEGIDLANVRIQWQAFVELSN
jgi:hypothetical protein